MDDPNNFLQVVVHGIHPRAGTAGPIMPAFGGTLDNDQIADLADYVRNRFTDEAAWDDIPGKLDEVRKSAGEP
jgi:nicotinate dehydrogenase subunit B